MQKKNNSEKPFENFPNSVKILTDKIKLWFLEAVILAQSSTPPFVNLRGACSSTSLKFELKKIRNTLKIP